MEKRTAALKERLTEKNIEAVLVYNRLNRRYISGFTGSSGYLYINDKVKLLLTDFRYLEQAAIQSPDFEIIDFTKKGLIPTIKDIIHDQNQKKIAFEGNELTYQQYKELTEGISDVTWVETSDLIESLRQIKDEEELSNIKEAARIADEAFSHIIPFLKVGVTEVDIALQLEYFMKRSGASNLSFDTIVASGKNSSLPHAQPTLKKIESGDFVTMDFGCIYKGYCSDMTRTVVVGKASDEHKKIYNTVLKAQMDSLAAVRAGLKGQEVDKVARDIIREAGYGDYFGHGLGHSLGLEVHENPRFNPSGVAIIQENMMMTVEPGIYIPNFGGVRIEDLVCVKQGGYENFTHSSKELLEL